MGVYVNDPNVSHVEMQISFFSSEITTLALTLTSPFFSLWRGRIYSPEVWNLDQRTEYAAEQTLRTQQLVIMPFASKDLKTEGQRIYSHPLNSLMITIQ